MDELALQDRYVKRGRRSGDADAAAAAAFYRANQAGIDSWNDYIAVNGLPLADLSDD